MKKATNTVAALTAIGIAFLATPAFAEDVTLVKYDATVEDDGSAKERINYSGRLRMLSQRIPSAACNYASGVASEATHKMLVSASEEFETILDALENGNPELNILSPETRQKTLSRLSDVREAWAPMKAAVEGLSAGEATDENLQLILDSNMNVLGSAVVLVGELVKQYANPNAATQADLMLVDISGRQRMLTQKMSKEACILASGYAQDEARENLQGTMQIFDASLNALKFGLSDVGIQPPPSDTISDGLDIVSQDWSGVQELLETALSGEEPSMEIKEERFAALNRTLASSNDVVTLYVQHSE